MIKSFGIGLFCALVAIVLGVFFSWELALQVAGLLTIVSIIVAGLIMGVGISGDQTRVNFMIEKKEDRYRKTNFATHVILFGVPNFVLALLVVLVTY